MKGLAGPGKRIAILCACTVIHPADLAETLLDRKRNPSWHGERFRLIERMPDDMERWQEYADLRRDAMLETNSDEETAKIATAFYLTHREELEAGAVVAWAERKEPGDVSALQHAMNIYFDDRAAFMAEYQNEPLIETENKQEITEETIRVKTVETAQRFTVPLECEHLTTAIDVHKGALFHMVTAWTDTFSGHVLDYGTFPVHRDRRGSRTAAQHYFERFEQLQLRLRSARSSNLFPLRRNDPAAIDARSRRDFRFLFR